LHSGNQLQVGDAENGALRLVGQTLNFPAVRQNRVKLISRFPKKITGAVFPNPSRRWSRRRPSAGGVPWNGTGGGLREQRRRGRRVVPKRFSFISRLVFFTVAPVLVNDR
jgi:hypothetical protein